MNTYLVAVICFFLGVAFEMLLSYIMAGPGPKSPKDGDW